MRVVIFTHSLVSDWNHGNAHFLRGIATELMGRGNQVDIYEPANGWSRQNLLADAGPDAISDFQNAYPSIRSTLYQEETLDLEATLRDADLALVHEWNSHGLVKRIGQHRAAHAHYQLFFHDTHHRSVTDPSSMSAYDLRNYDGVLAYGAVIRDIYIKSGWASRVFTWHEAADTRIFRPVPNSPKTADLVWIGNWGDGERTNELREFLIEPVRALNLSATVYGVRYPPRALEELQAAGIEYRGWLPNHRVPKIFSQHRVTIHIPRGPYATSLPGIPTIRPFEALAGGIPLVCAPWSDSEQLFRPGKDYLCAADGAQMTNHLRFLLSDTSSALNANRSLIYHGLETIRHRHTCAHRVNQLLQILGTVN